jgi:hypothetical protein
MEEVTSTSKDGGSLVSPKFPSGNWASIPLAGNAYSAGIGRRRKMPSGDDRYAAITLSREGIRLARRRRPRQPRGAAPRRRDKTPRRDCAYFDSPPPPGGNSHGCTPALGAPTPSAARGPRPATHPRHSASRSTDRRSFLRRPPPA